MCGRSVYAAFMQRLRSVYAYSLIMIAYGKDKTDINDCLYKWQIEQQGNHIPCNYEAHR